jgi:hypothetical protein
MEEKLYFPFSLSVKCNCLFMFQNMTTKREWNSRMFSYRRGTYYSVPFFFSAAWNMGMMA